MSPLFAQTGVSWIACTQLTVVENRLNVAGLRVHCDAQLQQHLFQDVSCKCRLYNVCSVQAVDAAECQLRLHNAVAYFVRNTPVWSRTSSPCRSQR